ncbi:LLM class flavin-dependent oxidoreductase [Streptomyces asiaticus]
MSLPPEVFASRARILDTLARLGPAAARCPLPRKAPHGTRHTRRCPRRAGAGATPEQRKALRFAPAPRDRVAPAPRDRDADPEFIARSARENEEDGLDSALVVQSSSWPDPWLVASWALAATSRLRMVVAHRVGTTMTASSTPCAAPVRACSRTPAPSCSPSAAPLQRVWRLPAATPTSTPSPPLPLSATRRHTARAHAAAAEHGRSLRIRRHVAIIAAPTDNAAEERARRIRQDATRLASGPDGPLAGRRATRPGP